MKFKFIALIIIACCFTYCNTSNNKIASSFFKRKYTKGHFFERPGKVNTEYIIYSKDNGIPDIRPVSEKAPGATVLLNSSQKSDAAPSMLVLFPKLLKYASVTSGNTLHYSLPETPANLPGHPEVLHNGFKLAEPYLIRFLVCALIAFTLVAFAVWDPATNSGYVPTTGCLLVVLAIPFAIAALVYLLIFLAALAPPVN